MQDRPEERPFGDADPASRRPEGLIADLARKAVSSSVAALLSSEDGIKAIIGAVVPKEVGRYVANELTVLREETVKALVGEISRFLNRVDPAMELQKVLSGLVFDIHLTVGVANKAETPPAAPAPEDVKPARAKRRKPG